MSAWQKFKQKMPFTKNVLKFTLYATAAISVGVGVVIGAPLAIAGAAAGQAVGALAGAAAGGVAAAVTGLNMLTGLVVPATLLTGIGETIYKTSQENGQTERETTNRDKKAQPRYANTQSTKGPNLSLKAKGQTRNAFDAAGSVDQRAENDDQTPKASSNKPTTPLPPKRKK